jgi:hypothetical protein
MGNVVPDRLFWAQPDAASPTTHGRRPARPALQVLRLPAHDTKHDGADRNQQLFDRARALIPGGVNSPVRAFRAVGGTPRFVQRAQGAYFWDANGSATSTTSAPGAR